MNKEHVSPHIEWERMAESLANTFFLRRDLYARQLDDGSYICIRKPLTIRHFVRHLQGDLTLGTYLLNDDNRTLFLVYDADDEEQFNQLVQAAVVLEGQGASPYLEQSRRGGHMWLFFYQPISGARARSFGKNLAKAFDLTDLEMFPKQDRLKEGPGSLIRLPFGIHRRSGKRYGFITTQCALLRPTITEQIGILNARRSVPKQIFMAYLNNVSKIGQETEITPFESSTSTLSQRIKNSVTAHEFISRYIELSPNGVGYCPFHVDNHRSFAVSLEGNYWNCFAGCGGGSIIDFWMKHQQCDFRTALRELAGLLL